MSSATVCFFLDYKNDYSYPDLVRADVMCLPEHLIERFKHVGDLGLSTEVISLIIILFVASMM